MAKIIKEIIIMLLVCLITMLLLAIGLYRYIPNRKTVPEIVTYTATEEVQDLLADNIDTKTGEDNVILTYEVTASDLNNYKNTNIYVPGKSNPFAPASSSTTDNGDTSNGNSNTGNNNNSSSTNQENSNKNTTQTNPNQSSESTTPNVYQNNGTK